jgi:hypothetical protein
MLTTLPDFQGMRAMEHAKSVVIFLSEIQLYTECWDGGTLTGGFGVEGRDRRSRLYGALGGRNKKSRLLMKAAFRGSDCREGD